MTLDKRLLEILRCPASGQALNPMTSAQLQRLNLAIREGTVFDAEGGVIDVTLNDALLTRNMDRIYRIDDGIPVMLVSESIPAQTLFASAD